MSTAQTINEFIEANAEEDQPSTETYHLETDRILEVLLDGMIYIKHGAMIGYIGAVKFDKAGLSDQGLGNFLKKAVTGEGMTLTKATGAGKLYLADRSKRILLLRLEDGDGLIVNGNDVLAFDKTIKYDITMMKSAGGMSAGGLFNIRFTGSGHLAITTHSKPLVLTVRPDQPVYTDPGATVAWSSSLSPSLKSDITFKTLTGRASGETFQMEFKGQGFVVIQPYEEIGF